MYPIKVDTVHIIFFNYYPRNWFWMVFFNYYPRNWFWMVFLAKLKDILEFYFLYF